MNKINTVLAVSNYFNIAEKFINVYENEVTGNITIEMVLLRGQKVENTFGLMENQIFENHPVLNQLVNYTFMVRKENYTQFFHHCYDLD
jgi:hypothetical protein